MSDVIVLNNMNSFAKKTMAVICLSFLMGGSLQVASSQGAAWKRVTWNPNRDGGYLVFPGMPGFLKPDITYTLNIPTTCALKPDEGSASIRTADSRGQMVVALEYYGDKQFRSKMLTTKGYNATFPNIHGYNWSDARSECDYQVKAYCHHTGSKYVNILSTKLSQQRTAGGIAFWRGDVKSQSKSGGTIKHHCMMVSDEGACLHFDSNPSTEYIVSSLRHQR